jgi:hypothetical protein
VRVRTNERAADDHTKRQEEDEFDVFHWVVPAHETPHCPLLGLGF